MLDVMKEIEHWFSLDEKIALATVVQTWGSSPRGVGAKMAFTESGKITGSVSGGCVEGQVIESGMETLKMDIPQLLHFGVSDETAFEVGLACGGSIDIFVEPFTLETFKIVSKEVKASRPISVITVVDGPMNLVGQKIIIKQDGSTIGRIQESLDENSWDYAKESMVNGKPKSINIEMVGEGQIQLFVDVSMPSPTLVIVGGVHIAIALASLAKIVGFKTILVDPRRAFASIERFPHVNELIQEWPQEAFQKINLNSTTAVAVLTHDPKIDDPALKIAIDSPVFYIGALGSKKTNQMRHQRLSDQGITESQLDRIHAPIGLDLGSKTPEELALSILSEIVAARRKRTI